MADREVDVLLVGGGVASASCAEELRERGFDGSVLLVGRDDTARKPEPCAPAAAHHAGPADLGQPGRKKLSP